jgi:predicted O-methyltransferase YrrM
MPDDLFAHVDAYIERTITPHDDALDRCLEDARAAGLPEIAVTPPLGKLLHLLARLSGAERVLELGTLGGYSTIWLARALPDDGALVTIELDVHHAEVARKSLERAAVANKVEILVGDALEILPTLGEREPFDLVFIDADKEHIPAYVEHSLALTRPGSVIVVDNVVREGALVDEADTSPQTLAARALHDLIARHPRLTATTLQTVGAKKHDGMTIALVEG